MRAQRRLRRSHSSTIALSRSMEADNTMSAYVPRVTYANGETHVLGPDFPYRSIDRTQLRLFELVNRTTQEVAVKMHVLPHQRLIWRMRGQLHPGGAHIRAHIIGKQHTSDSKNYQGIIVFFESDGSMEPLERFRDDHAFFSPIILEEYETV